MLGQMKVDGVLALLFAGILFFTAVLMFLAFKLKDDGQTFQLFAGCLTGFVGAFLGRLDPKKKDTPAETQA